MSERKVPSTENLPRISVKSAISISVAYFGLADRGCRDGWDREMQSQNFKFAFDLVHRLGGTPDMYSLLDVGCGNGKFAQIWHEHGGKEYTGIDLVAPDDENFKKLYSTQPNYSFINAEFTREPLDPVDLAIASGSLSIGLPNDKYLHFIAYLEKMMILSRRGIYLNYWEEFSNRSNNDIFIDYNSKKIDTLITRMMSKRGFNTYERISENYMKGEAIDTQQHVYILKNDL